MNKIKNISQIMLIILKGSIVLLAIGTLFGWIFGDKDSMLKLVPWGFGPVTGVGLSFPLSKGWTLDSRVVAAAAIAIYRLPLFLGLFAVKDIFSNYQNGDIFTTANAKHYRRLGIIFFLDALITTPIGGALMSVAATLSKSAKVFITFGTTNFQAMFCGALIIVISWVMLEGSKINEENKYTV